MWRTPREYQSISALVKKKGRDNNIRSQKSDLRKSDT